MPDRTLDPDDKPAIERAIETLVYAPIGLALFARELLPPLVDEAVARGRKRVEEFQKQVGDQLMQARIVGQFAVAQGQQQIQRDIIDRFKGAEPDTEAEAGPAPRVEAHPAAPIAEPTAGASGNGRGRADTSGLPIPDYDELSASQVVARLSGLNPAELDSVRAYEVSQRRRKTILTRIEQLTA